MQERSKKCLPVAQPAPPARSIAVYAIYACLERVHCCCRPPSWRRALTISIFGAAWGLVFDGRMIEKDSNGSCTTVGPLRDAVSLRSGGSCEDLSSRGSVRGSVQGEHSTTPIQSVVISYSSSTYLHTGNPHRVYKGMKAKPLLVKTRRSKRTPASLISQTRVRGGGHPVSTAPRTGAGRLWASLSACRTRLRRQSSNLLMFRGRRGGGWEIIGVGVEGLLPAYCTTFSRRLNCGPPPLRPAAPPAATPPKLTQHAPVHAVAEPLIHLYGHLVRHAHEEVHKVGVVHLLGDLLQQAHEAAREPLLPVGVRGGVGGLGGLVSRRAFVKGIRLVVKPLCMAHASFAAAAACSALQTPQHKHPPFACRRGAGPAPTPLRRRRT